MKSQHLGYLDYVEMIGKGCYAEIWKVFSKTLNSFFVAKIEAEVLDEVRNEYEVMSAVEHPLVCQFYGQENVLGKRVGLLEYIEGDTLLRKVNMYGAMPERDARVIAVQICSMLQHLHKDLGIIHRDIKCENIIVDKMGNARLIDFGFATKFEGKSEKPKYVCGSPEYLAPEAIAKMPACFASDVWSLGVVLFAITTGILPFDQTNQSELFKSIACSEPNYPATMSDELTDLLKRILSKDPLERISLDQILEHPWMMPMINGKRMHPDLSFFNKLQITPHVDEEIDMNMVQCLCHIGFDQDETKKHLLGKDDDSSVFLYKFYRRQFLTSMFYCISANIFVENDLRSSNGSWSFKNPRIGQSCVFAKFAPKNQRHKFSTVISRQSHIRVNLTQPTIPQNTQLAAPNIVIPKKRTRHHSNVF